MAKTKTAMVSKEIRNELMKAFPFTQFSVRSFSKDGNIRIEWTDLPSAEFVSIIVDKYADDTTCISLYPSFSLGFKNKVESLMEKHEKESFYWSSFDRIMNKMWIDLAMDCNLASWKIKNKL